MLKFELTLQFQTRLITIFNECKKIILEQPISVYKFLNKPKYKQKA